MTPTAGRVQGLRSRGNASAVEVGPGYARDSADARWLQVPDGQSRQLDLGVSGPGGLDAPLQLGTAYALYIVQAPGQESQLVGSTAFAGPNLPGAAWRRIGSFAVDQAGNVVRFVQQGSANDRQVRYIADPSVLEVLANGNATTFTPVDCAPLVHAESELFFIGVHPIGGVVTIRPEGGGTEESTGTSTSLPLYVPANTTRVDFKCDGPTTLANLSVRGFGEVI